MLGLFDITNWLDTSSMQSTVKSLTVHIFFLQNYLPYNPNGPTWSLAVEEHFYILLPLIFLALMSFANKRNFSFFDTIPWLTFSSIIICGTLRYIQSLDGIDANEYMQTHLRIDSLMIGVFTQYLWLFHQPIIDFVWQHRWFFLAAALAMVSTSAFYSTVSPFMFTWGFLILSIGYAIILVLVYRGLLAAWEDNLIMRSFAKIGTWSYNSYLWHYFLFAISIPVFISTHEAIDQLNLRPILIVSIQALHFIIYSILIGYIVTAAIENPFIKLRNKLYPSKYQLDKTGVKSSTDE